MSSPDPADAAPLSPEAKALIARARRSFLFSMGVLLVGFMVIAGVLVYRSAQGGGSAGGAYAAAALVLPPGAELVSASAAGGQVTLTVKTAGGMFVRVHDGKTGALVGEMQVVSP